MPEHLTLSYLLEYGGAGALGALVHTLAAHKGVLMLPKKVKTGVQLGFLASLLFGVVTALVVDTSWITAIFASMSGPQLIETLASKKEKDSKNEENDKKS